MMDCRQLQYTVVQNKLAEQLNLSHEPSHIHYQQEAVAYQSKWKPMKWLTRDWSARPKPTANISVKRSSCKFNTSPRLIKISAIRLGPILCWHQRGVSQWRHRLFLATANYATKWWQCNMVYAKIGSTCNSKTVWPWIKLTGTSLTCSRSDRINSLPKYVSLCCSLSMLRVSKNPNPIFCCKYKIFKN